MTAIVEKSRQRDIIPLRTYALPVAVPQAFSFSLHMPKFLGLDQSQVAPDVLWGVHGTSSLNSADAFASRDAQRLGRRLYQLEISYQLEGLPPAGTSVTEEFAQLTGYLHFSRITSAFREKLRERLLRWLFESRDSDRQRIAGFDFDQLIKERPMFVHHIMKEDRNLKAVIHPVLLPGGVSIRLATVRNSTENITRVYTRFHEEIITTV